MAGMTPTEAAFLSGAFRKDRSWQACPVCQGRGWVRAGFYSGDSSATSTANETCRTCKGATVIERPR